MKALKEVEEIIPTGWSVVSSKRYSQHPGDWSLKVALCKNDSKEEWATWLVDTATYVVEDGRYFDRASAARTDYRNRHGKRAVWAFKKNVPIQTQRDTLVKTYPFVKRDRIGSWCETVLPRGEFGKVIQRNVTRLDHWKNGYSETNTYIVQWENYHTYHTEAELISMTEKVYL